MARVSIDSGDMDATYRFRHIPKDKWSELLKLRRDLIEVEFASDCSKIVEFVSDVEEVYEELGFDSPEQMVREGYGLDPTDVEAVVNYLKRERPHVVEGFDATVAKLGKHGGDRRSEGFQVGDANLVSSKGTTSPYLLARIARDFPDVNVEDYPSVRKAAIECGIIKEKTNLEKALAAFKKLSDSERLEFFRIATEDEG